MKKNLSSATLRSRTGTKQGDECLDLASTGPASPVLALDLSTLDGKCSVAPQISGLPAGKVLGDWQRLWSTPS